jgi:hypothetical protein
MKSLSVDIIVSTPPNILVAIGSKQYWYFGLQEYELKKLRLLLHKKAFGKAIKFLKQFSRPELVNE